MQDLVAILCEYLYDNPTTINDVFLIYKIINLSCLLLVHNYYETLVVEKTMVYGLRYVMISQPIDS